MANKNTVSKLTTLPYSNPHGEDYHDQPVGKARKRKIEHVRRLLAEGKWSKSRVHHYALHDMNMPGNDIVEAFKDTK